MKIAGIIAEYNPFHDGHAYHIEHTRAEKGGDATHIVAVMSGCFTQRGEPALTDPYLRAKAALENGVDLVLMLPTPWALSSAEGFARGGVEVLEGLGCVDMLSFGSECGDLDALHRVRRLLDDPSVTARMKGLMSTGLSYAAARSSAVAERGGPSVAALLDSPNNTLGIEYMGALHRTQSQMSTFTVKRLGAAHDEQAPIGGTASASYLREALRRGRINNLAPYMPGSVCRLLHEAAAWGRCPSRESLGERAVLSTLRTLSKDTLAALPAVSEGIENRLYTAIDKAPDLNTLFELAKTKRYTRTRLQRLVYNAFLGISKDLTLAPVPYIHVLGANTAGREILKKAKESGRALPLITRASQVAALDDRARALYELECRAADLFAMFLPTPYPRGLTMTEGLITL